MKIDGQSPKKKMLQHNIMVLLVMSVIFFVLYHNFLFGGQMYAYSDVGADTIDQYLPNIVYETRMLRSGIIGKYSLSYGFGKYIGGLLLKYLNPVNLPLLLLGETRLPAALMLSLYLKYALLCLFAQLYFNRVLKDLKVASVCALLWTFSGYAVLWGQHYHFLTMILSFTVVMYGFQLYLEEDKHWYFVIPAMALLMSTTYYFTYISCFFLLIYGVLFLLYHNVQPGKIFKKAAAFVPLVVLAACMAGEKLAVDVTTFFDSFRVSQVTSQLSGEFHYPLRNIYGYLARFFSNDLIGIGDTFYGPVNYYEFAILSVSILSVFAFAFLVQGKNWKRVILICICCAVSLCLPSVNQLLTFSKVTQRWTYLLCFVQILGIGCALAEASKTNNGKLNRKRILCAVLISDIILLVSFLVLYRFHIFTGGWILNRSACLKLAIIIVAYHLVVIPMVTCRKYAFVALLTIVALELSLANYASVNQRKIVSIEQWENAMYHDGTEEVVEWIREQDDSLYRIGKTYTSVSNCDALLQGFNGTSTYDSTNSASLISIADAFGYSGVGNRIRFAGNDLLANTMLGVKYVITNKTDSLDPLFYTKIYSDETHCVYEYKFGLGFGYVYRQSSQQADILAGTTIDTLMALSDSFYYTEPSNAERRDRTVCVDLLPYLTAVEDCEIAEGESLTAIGSGYNMCLVFALPEIPEDHLAAGVRITLSAQSPSTVTVVTESETDDGAESRRDVVNYDAGTGTYELNTVNSPDISNVRVYASWAPQTVTIESFELLLIPGQGALQQNLLELKETNVISAQISGSMFTFKICDASEDGMLVVPMIFNRYWRAIIDNKPVEIYNVNGGFVGIPFKSGTSEVILEYYNPPYTIGMFLSVLGIAIFFLVAAKSTEKDSVRRE